MATQEIEHKQVSRIWLDTTQLSDYLGIERSTIYQYVRELRIPYHKVPGSQLLRFRRDEVDEWMATGRVETAQEYYASQIEGNNHGDDPEAQRQGQ